MQPAAAQVGKQQMRMVLATVPGSAPDVIARLVAEQFRAKFGQPVLVENKPGAGGIIAVNYAKGGEANGTVLLFAQAAVCVVTPHTFKEAKYDIERDFETVGVVASTPMLFVSNMEKGPKTWAEAVSRAKSEPDKVVVGSPNRTSIPHLAGELAGQKVGGRFRNIPMSNTGQGLQAVVNGDTDMYVDGIAAILPLVRAGRVRPLAVTADKMYPGLENYKLAHDVIPGFDVSGWFMLFANKGTPPAVLEQLNAALNEALRQPDVVAKMAEFGTYPVGGSLADGQAFLRNEKKLWAGVLSAAGFDKE